MKRLLYILLLLAPLSATAGDHTQNLLQMLDYLGVDYPGAVRNGEVLKAGEYAEMQEFAAGIKGFVQALPDNAAKPTLVRQSEHLAALVKGKADGGEIAALTGTMHGSIMVGYQVAAVPASAPDLGAAARLFQQQCAACHGAKGQGDGPRAAALSPPPINFHDPQRRSQRTVYGLYNTISLGVPGTAMAAYQQLSEQQRWNLAFYVAQLGSPAARVAKGAQIWQAQGVNAPLAALEQVTTVSPAEAARTYGEDGAAVLAYLRGHPDQLFKPATGAPLAFARSKLHESVAAYQKGDTQGAYQAAISAYLEGFELVEGGLNASAPHLREKIEGEMTVFRNMIRARVPAQRLAAQGDRILEQLGQAQDYLDRGTLSGAAAFTGALVILLREGLEAILVIAAFVAFLRKTGRRDAMPYIHIGWGGALLAGAATWVVSSYVIQIGGASRELTEGVAAIVAAVVLFGLGFWLHDKAHAAQWKRFIEERMSKALGATTLWSLALLSFVVVYREIFETILFYEALWLQTTPAGQGMVLTGFGVAVAALTVLAWLILRYSQRLPLRQFFGVTGMLLLVLAVIFAGKGIAAFQEAGSLPSSPVDLPSIELLGIYPNLQGLLVQLAMVALAAVMVWYGNRRAARQAAA